MLIAKSMTLQNLKAFYLKNTYVGMLTYLQILLFCIHYLRKKYCKNVIFILDFGPEEFP